MIPKERIEQAAMDYIYANYGSSDPNFDLARLTDNYTDFTAGVSFAESELKSVAMEFAEWCANNNYQWNKTYKYWYNDRLPLKTELVFAKFEAERQAQ